MNVKALKIIKGHNGAIYDVASFSDEKAYTTSADKYVARWDLNKGIQDDFAVKLDVSGFKLTLSSDAKTLVIGNAKGGIHVIDLIHKKEVKFLEQHKSPIFALTFNDKTNEFYSADAKGYFCVWDKEHFNLKLTLPFNCGKIRQIALSEDREYIAICGQDGYVRILETKFYNEIQSFKPHNTGVNCAVFQGDFIYTGGKNAHIALWNWKEGKKHKVIPAHNYAVYDLICIDNGKLLVSASFDKTIKLWNTKTLDVIQRIERKDGGHLHTVNRLAKIDEKKFLSVSDDKSLIYWSI